MITINGKQLITPPPGSATVPGSIEKSTLPKDFKYNLQGAMMAGTGMPGPDMAAEGTTPVETNPATGTKVQASPSVNEGPVPVDGSVNQTNNNNQQIV